MAGAENTNFEFGIQNFKPYANLQSIELGKITLIYGSNSSGKSSFIQGFLCAAQSSESSTCSLILNGEFVKCGTYSSILNRKLKNAQKEVVLSSSSSTKVVESSFNFVRRGRKKNLITFDHKNQINLRVFYKKSITPGILEISKLGLILPNIQASKGIDPCIADAYLLANKPHNLKKEPCYLEDIDHQWMSACIELIRFIGDDLKKLLQEINTENGDSGSESTELVGYEINGRLNELNLLYCAAHRIGAWIVVDEFNTIEDTFNGYIYPSLMPYLSGKFFVATAIDRKIKELHLKIEKYFSCFEKCSKEFNFMSYSLGSEFNASWAAIPVREESVSEFAVAIEDDSDCTKYRNQLLVLAKEIRGEINNKEKRGSSLMGKIGVETQNLKDSYIILDDLIQEFEKFSSNSNDNNTLLKRISDKTVDADIVSHMLSGLFQKAGQTINYLTSAYQEFQDAKEYLGIDIEINDKNFSDDELEKSLSRCRALNDKLKLLFGDLSAINLFLSLISDLNRQIKETHEIIASKANDLHFLSSSGKKERSAIDLVKKLINNIEDFFDPRPYQQHTESQPGFPSVRTLIPIFKNIQILPPHHRKERIIHLGPDRPGPKRSYSIDEINSDPQLRFLPEWDSEKEELFPNLHQRKYSNELACLNIRGEDIVRINTSDSLLNQCSIGILNGQTVTNICDLGFGLSQVIPLVIASKIPKKDLIVVQQPETHLHPAMQADLGDLLIQSVVLDPNDNSIDSKKWLIETHSEVLMLRILRRLREGKSKLNPSDLKIYFVDQNDEGVSRIQQMKFTKSGDLLTRWPKGFFAQESMEL